MWEACGKPQKCKLEFTSDVAGLKIGNLSQENFTAIMTRSDRMNRSDRFFLSPASAEVKAFVEPKSFRLLSVHNHSLVIVELKMNS
jgi:hypothetical protein